MSLTRTGVGRGAEGDAVLDQVVARCDRAGVGVSRAGRFQAARFEMAS